MTKEEQTREILEFLGDLLKELACHDVSSWKQIAWEMIEKFEKDL